MADQQTPEMMRLSLQDLALRVKICKLGAIEQVLSQALDAPLPKNIKRAIDSLVEVGCRDATCWVCESTDTFIGKSLNCGGRTHAAGAPTCQATS